MQHVEYLREHHDEAMAAGYLQNVVVNDADIAPRDRARAILELADCLQNLGRHAETLCWLKIWMGLFPAGPETAAVAYRMGRIYTQMGLRSLARDSYYLALSFAINQGQVQNADDLQRYQRLTNGTLWALADNEYQAGEWARAAELVRPLPARGADGLRRVAGDGRLPAGRLLLPAAAKRQGRGGLHGGAGASIPSIRSRPRRGCGFTISTSWPSKPAQAQARAAGAGLDGAHRLAGATKPTGSSARPSCCSRSTARAARRCRRCC